MMIALSRQTRGFTLLETLVVLVLVTLVMGLLVQMFLYILQFRGRFISLLEEQRIETLQRHWLQTTVGNLVSVPPGHDRQFAGTTVRLNGTTLNSLTGGAGIPVAFSLEAVKRGSQSILLYREDSGTEWILHQSQVAESAFRYLGSKGEWHSEWPHDRLQREEQLPTAVQLTWRANDGNRTWLMRVRGDHREKPELLSGRTR